MNIGIYIVTHKEFEKPKGAIYIPIIAGAFEHDKNEEFQGYLLDNTEDNISKKHYLYSEFTVIYWIWKNSPYDIVGENHYRRYFIKGAWLEYLKCFFTKCEINEYIVDKEDIEKIFDAGYNCILPKKQAHFNYTMYDFYCNAREDGILLFEVIRRIVKKNCPEYSVDLEKMLKLKVNYFKCINVMKKELFDQMAEWIFDIFDELEKIDIDYKEREFAFLGEWLVNAWIIHNKNNGTLKIKELFYINTECTYANRNYVNHDTIWPIWLALICNILFHNKILRMGKKVLKNLILNIKKRRIG